MKTEPDDSDETPIVDECICTYDFGVRWVNYACTLHGNMLKDQAYLRTDRG